MPNDPPDGDTLARWLAARTRATPGPMLVEQGHTDYHFVHWNVVTVQPQPDAPWAPRLICWLSGMIAESRYEHSRTCPTCHYTAPIPRRLLVPFDVRHGDQTEADAAYIALCYDPALMQEIAALAAEVRRWQGLERTTRAALEAACNRLVAAGLSVDGLGEE